MRLKRPTTVARVKHFFSKLYCKLVGCSRVVVLKPELLPDARYLAVVRERKFSVLTDLVVDPRLDADMAADLIAGHGVADCGLTDLFYREHVLRYDARVKQRMLKEIAAHEINLSGHGVFVVIAPKVRVYCSYKDHTWYMRVTYVVLQEQVLFEPEDVQEFENVVA